MFKGIKAAYGAGRRAGSVPAVIIVMPNGTKQLGKPQNPFTERQFLRREAWESGFHAARMQRLNVWLDGRRV